MKVLMLGRHHLLEQGGGDKIQIENTCKELRKMGVEVEIKTNSNFNPAEYDLVHIFQLDWTPETYFYSKKVAKFGKPLVLSPIHHNIEEVKKFDDTYVFDFRRISRLLFKDQFKRDTFKNVYRSLTDTKKFLPTLFSVFYGFKRMQREVLEMSDIVLVQTNLEAQDLESTFGTKLDYRVVQNGVSSEFSSKIKYPNPLGFEDYIISVGRIEPRKNQLNLIKALQLLREKEKKDLQLVLIGKISKFKHFEYTTIFKKYLRENNWIHHFEKVSYSEMPAFYQHAKVGVSASWFETTGLTSLEALFCGANAVASGERAKECLKDYAFYCRPENIESISDAVLRAFIAPRPEVAPEFASEYTWEKAADKTLSAYMEVMERCKK